ncbi:dipicolinate synthase subunit B [Clostridium thermosuccinogenes]|jgi:dipicolinate synthase subunit B|uniref:Dipicolinate synthase subunit B n=1 Tax=Clostridium thermosuccinogenes TaxID=84032 RepID=A0A2K2FCB6_9CLOT|nr:dipicolinate synthase subunit B [Pseudoclostridium thermosuccinogenes]AUS96210.1 dipicolinate synthase subunit B [Pseudoclostridium thermosuccinogenes]PNT93109.1 dipicolinate synthase subunit B [Pseudoclostridium thermosuccinogenes]PNT96415.1 dipicolinate synthase subunit B [Pseudoclostridium thermosuccinogenes]PNT98068.1 dipicolinate synthase subunit B [Pseudoclostridium thermosuccinogenes]
MLLEGVKVGFALTGSFCTFAKVFAEIEKLVGEGADVYPIISESVDKTDTRYGSAIEWKNRLRVITGKDIISTIAAAEPIGPKGHLDILVVAPCTGNTLAKLANAINDTPVTMAVKAHLRNQKPVVLAVSTNDALGNNAKNLGVLLNAKNIYFVPFEQDDPEKKVNSLVAKMDLLIPTIQEALKGKQIQPILR